LSGPLRRPGRWAICDDRATVANEYTVQLPMLHKLGESFLTRDGENKAEAILGNVKAKMEA